MTISFDWSEYLTLAKELQANKTVQQAALRSAISRSYYATYCTARDFIANKNPKILHKASEDHQVVASYFSSGVRARVGEHLTRLRRWRNDCDYENQTKLDLEITTYNAIKIAEMAIGILKT